MVDNVVKFDAEIPLFVTMFKFWWVIGIAVFMIGMPLFVLVVDVRCVSVHDDLDLVELATHHRLTLIKCKWRVWKG